ncbi:MAG: sialidase family protein [Acidimicrobiales bacterium]
MNPRLVPASAIALAAVLALASCSSSDGSDAASTTTTAVASEVGAPTSVATAEHTPYNLSTSAGGELVAVAWNDYDEDAGTEAPMVAVSTDGGETFGDPVALDPDDPYVAYPQVAVTDDGNVYVGVTLDEDGDEDGRPGLYRSTDEGASFELVADLEDAPRVSFTNVGTTVAVSPDGEQVVMGWTTPGAEGTAGALYGTVSADGGETFADPVELDADAGAGRPRAFAGTGGSGVASVVAVPLADAPKPTPANPNPVTSSPQVEVFEVDGTGFGEGMALTTADEPAADEGPGAAGTDADPVIAWWVAGEEGASLVGAAVDGPDAASVALLPKTLDVASPIDVAVDEAGTWWVATLEAPVGDGSDPAPLTLVAVADGGDPKVVDGVDPSVTRSAEEFDVTALPGGGALVVWFEDTAVKAQTVR